MGTEWAVKAPVPYPGRDQVSPSPRRRPAPAPPTARRPSASAGSARARSTVARRKAHGIRATDRRARAPSRETGPTAIAFLVVVLPRHSTSFECRIGGGGGIAVEITKTVIVAEACNAPGPGNSISRDVRSPD